VLELNGTELRIAHCVALVGEPDGGLLRRGRLQRNPEVALHLHPDKVSYPLPMDTLSVDDVFVALAHPVRRSLLDSLASGEKPVNQLASAYKVSRPAISQHLRILLDAGLIEGRREGRTNCYALRPQQLAIAYQWMRQYERFWDDRMSRLGGYLDRTNRQQERTHKGEPS
jgi:DNA-binding transcriptional ArsR family regulator